MATGSQGGSIDIKKTVLIAALLGSLAFVIFSPAIGYGFVNYDDDVYVYENPVVSKGLSPAGIQYAFTTTENGTWAPLMWLSYEFDATLFGLRAGSFHFVNILLHAVAGALLFVALQLMLRMTWASVTVSLVFLLHPLRTESVVWIAERKDVLCALFWMAGLVAYWWYANKSTPLRWTLVFLCFLAGLASKMMMVTFPFVLLLLDFWPLNRCGVTAEIRWSRVRRLLLEKLPFFIVSFLAVLVTAGALNTQGALSPAAEASDGPWRVLNHYAFYLGKIFWPTNLSVLYPVLRVPAWQLVTNGLLLAGLTGVALWKARTMPWLIVGWLWFVGTLVPVIGFVPFGAISVADRYVYIPSVGLILALAVAVNKQAERFQRPLWAATAVVGVICGVLVISDLPRWRDSVSLYNSALRVGPHFIAYNNRGVTLLKAGDRQAALADFNAALQINPAFERSYCNRGSLLCDAGRYDEALADLNQALKYNPRSAEAFSNRGNVYARTGRPTEALVEYGHALKLRPEKGLYYNNRAATYFDLKRYPEAMEDIKMCERLGGRPHPGLVDALKRAMAQTP